MLLLTGLPSRQSSRPSLACSLACREQTPEHPSRPCEPSEVQVRRKQRSGAWGRLQAGGLESSWTDTRSPPPPHRACGLVKCLVMMLLKL